MKQRMINWRKLKPSTKCTMISIGWIITSMLVIKYHYTSEKERTKGEDKKLRPIRYGPFEIVEILGIIYSG